VAVGPNPCPSADTCQGRVRKHIQPVNKKMECAEETQGENKLVLRAAQNVKIDGENGEGGENIPMIGAASKYKRF